MWSFHDERQSGACEPKIVTTDPKPGKTDSAAIRQHKFRSDKQLRTIPRAAGPPTKPVLPHPIVPIMRVLRLRCPCE